jgi:hypothetical protein
MAEKVDPAASLSPEDDLEEPQDAEAATDAEERQDARSVGPEGEPERQDEDAEEPEDDRSVTEILDQLGRELGDLGLSEAQLEAARNLPKVRRTARDIAGALVVVVAAVTAFAFLNVAAVAGLSKVLSTWLAALVIAAVWFIVGGVLLFFFMGRARRWLLWIVLKAPPTEAMEELERERNAAFKAARSTLERLGPAIAIQIALAAVPKAGDVAGGVASGVVDLGDSALEASDETIEVIAEQIPGGGVANQVWSVVLMPGRLGIRVATTVLRRGSSRNGGGE